MVDVRIKPLEWEELHAQRSDEDPTTEWNGGYKADSAFGYYEISMGFGSDAYYWTVSDPLSNDIGSDFDDPSDAKAAAQADYERRIRSTLSDAVAEREAEPVAWQHRLKSKYEEGRWTEWREGKVVDQTTASHVEVEERPLYTTPPASELEAENARLQAERDEATVYMRNLLLSFVGEHFPDNDGWKPLGDLVGMLTQIDNASTIAREYKARIAALEAQLADRVKDEPAAFLVERLAGSGYGRARKIIDAAIYDPRRDDFWIGDGKKNHLVTPLYALSALEATPPAPKVTEADMEWLFQFRENWVNDGSRPNYQQMAKAYAAKMHPWEAAASIYEGRFEDDLTAAQEAGKP